MKFIKRKDYCPKFKKGKESNHKGTFFYIHRYKILTNRFPYLVKEEG